MPREEVRFNLQNQNLFTKYKEWLCDATVRTVEVGETQLPYIAWTKANEKKKQLWQSLRKKIKAWACSSIRSAIDFCCRSNVEWEYIPTEDRSFVHPQIDYQITGGFKWCTSRTMWAFFWLGVGKQLRPLPSAVFRNSGRVYMILNSWCESLSKPIVSNLNYRFYWLREMDNLFVLQCTGKFLRFGR